MIYVAKLEGNHVNIYNAQTGGYHRTIPSGLGSQIINAVVQGNIVVVSYANGRTAIHNAETGALERII